MKFTSQDVPDLSGKTVVVTGGNSGIGYEAARVLARRRARVVLACRDPGKMKAAADRLVAETKDAEVEQIPLDLASLDSVRAAVREIARRHDRIDVLVNNAGVMAIPYRETAEGIEMQMGTNHFGHFAFTGLLLPRLSGVAAARIVTVSSGLHARGHIVFEDIPKPTRYVPFDSYAMSKLANLLFAYELDRRLKAAGASVASVACHPGYAATNLQYVGPEMEGSGFKRAMMTLGNATIAQSAEMGALPTLCAATSAEVQGGDYVGPKGFFGIRGYPGKVKSNAESYDEAIAERLWETSETLTGVKYSFSRGAPGESRALV